MSKVLIVYPHGLGDCILATPAIRHMKKTTDNFIGFATLERFRSAELFKNNPYVDEVIYTKDAWNDYPSFEEGTKDVQAYCEQYAKENKYDKVIMVKHSPDGSKIMDCFTALELWHDTVVPMTIDFHTEVYLTDKDRDWAKKRKSKWRFIHSKTGVSNKDIPEGYARKWMDKNLGSPLMGTKGIYYEIDKFTPITKAFAILESSLAVVVADSVFYHAAGAMDKDIDLAYFARGPQVYQRVRPLHHVNQNIVYQLEPL